MPSYHRETWVDAPLSDVWAFHSRTEGLTAVTPGFMNLRVERVVGPDGEEDPAVLDVGTRIEMSMRPFDVGPRQSWTSVVTEREVGDDGAYFKDEMEDGPFPRWEHTHRFYASGASKTPRNDERGGTTHESGEDADAGETLLSDRVEFELPFGALGEQVAPFADLGFEPLFRARHRRTKQLLEREQLPEWVHGGTDA